MKKVMEAVADFAPTEAIICFSGETGTGKSKLAHYVHHLSTRSEKKFVKLDCGAVTTSLIESALFGHKKGAFTGAIQEEPGFFREASGGTLFLDEIGELDLQFQKKLLTVIQEKQVIPVGDTRPVKVDVRLLTATNTNLQNMVAAGNFRADLYYRIHVLPIEIPPLRQRREDIIPIANHLLTLLCADNNITVPSITKEALRFLYKYNFPGNIRELENVLLHSAIKAKGGKIGPAELPYEVTQRENSLGGNTSSLYEGIDKELHKTPFRGVRGISRDGLQAIYRFSQSQQQKPFSPGEFYRFTHALTGYRYETTAKYLANLKALGICRDNGERSNRVRYRFNSAGFN
jgi:transcriptional regulator with PAS, ATPase and Fis domain